MLNYSSSVLLFKLISHIKKPHTLLKKQNLIFRKSINNYLLKAIETNNNIINVINIFTFSKRYSFRTSEIKCVKF